jgi:hypothetical protein
MNSNEKKPLLSINNQRVITRKEMTLVNSDTASCYYCCRLIMLVIIIIVLIIGIIYIIKNNK